MSVPSAQSVPRLHHIPIIITVIIVSFDNLKMNAQYLGSTTRINSVDDDNADEDTEDDAITIIINN